MDNNGSSKLPVARVVRQLAVTDAVRRRSYHERVHHGLYVRQNNYQPAYWRTSTWLQPYTLLIQHMHCIKTTVKRQQQQQLSYTTISCHLTDFFSAVSPGWVGCPNLGISGAGCHSWCYCNSTTTLSYTASMSTTTPS